MTKRRPLTVNPRLSASDLVAVCLPPFCFISLGEECFIVPSTFSYWLL